HRPLTSFPTRRSSDLPNNPTGTYVTRAEVLRFLDAIPGETLVVFDEAYVEYVEAPDFPDVLELIREGRRVVSTRTFSKIHGLARSEEHTSELQSRENL